MIRKVWCLFSHYILRVPMDFRDFECMNCSIPLGAIETHEKYPLVICKQCERYTTVGQVLEDILYTDYLKKAQGL